MPAPDSPRALPGPSKPASLETLRPRFEKPNHEFYVDLLVDALEDDHENLNISLSGQYGSGKSSILLGLQEALKQRRPDLQVIRLTLSTLNSETAKQHAEAQESMTPAGNASDAAVTRALEREIVKQLLYRAEPRKMPGSRFRRTQAIEGIETFNWVLAALVVVGLIGAGLILQILWLTLAGAGVLAGAATAWAVRRGGSGLTLKQLGAAGASLHLDDSRAYFDDYLDDIIYFFQVSKVQVVVFEDLDRFNNLSIFESLRELNILLNETDQLKAQHPIRFIYATRDSIFEHADPRAKRRDQRRVGGPESVGSSRTKFFDLVVPVVPFATRRTSRDHLTRVAGTEVDPELVDLVAREITDMRLIRNIGNEFRVFQPRVLREDVKVLTPTRLFAMIVYKNVYPSEFEQISVGTSELDAVRREYRNIINATARKLETLPTATPLHPELADAARRLEDAALILGDVTGLVLPNGQRLPKEDWRTYAFWRAVAETETPTRFQFELNAGRVAPLGSTGPLALFREPLTGNVSMSWSSTQAQSTSSSSSLNGPSSSELR